MALNKRKVLDSARKYAQKGAKAKALKEYQLLLQADPRDAKLLLEVGDAYRRWGQIEDAIAQYAKVAQQYRQDGFDARAVAVYKQILNLDPKHYSAYVSLSELYQRMGLDSEAVGALQTAADGYHREGRKGDALELLRQMAALDPTNTTSRLKVAELLRQEKMNAEALSEYEAAARELENQEDREQLAVVRERILELKPDHLGALTGIVRGLMVAGQLDRAEPYALRALQASGEPAQYELLIELFAQMGNDAKLAEATRGLAKVYRDRGDEDKARELMQRLPADEVGARSRLAVDVSEVDEPSLGDDELLEDDPFVTVSGKGASRPVAAAAAADDDLELELELDEEEIQLEAPRAAGRPPVQAAVGDPDQMLAEASVYLRYGKRAQAIESLRAVIDQDPRHRAALEKLGEAYADDGQSSEAVAIWLRAAEQIRIAGDVKALAVLRDRIATLNPKAAAGLDSAAASKGSAGPARGASVAPARPAAAEPEETAELDLEDELELAAAAIDDPIEESSEVAFELDGDIDLDAELQGNAASSQEAAVDDGSGLSLAADGSFEFEIDADEISHDASDSSEEIADARAGTSTHGTTTTTERIREELEEAEFYIAQEMFGEAESILTRILELAPNHPSALLRMGEIQVARGAAPESTPASPEARTRAGRRVAGTSEKDLGSTARFEDGIDLTGPDDDASLDGDSLRLDESGTNLTVDEGEWSAEEDSGLELDLDGVRGVEVESDGESATPVEVEVEREPAPAVALKPTPAPSRTVKPVTAPVAPPVAVPGPVTPPVPVPAPARVEPIAAVLAADPEDSFDLREALADVIDSPADSQRGTRSSAALSTVEDGFESIFADFKKGVSATLDQGDYDTRYDLGIAYREMGLYEDAIGEFKICLESPTRRFDSLYLMGLCARDLQRYTDSVHHLEQALALPDLPSDRTPGVYFDLALAQDLAGDRDRARANMRRVLELDPRFPNAAQRLAELEQPAAGVGSASSGSARAETASGFESFDDLFAEDEGPEADSTIPPVESFESFDDVISDVETSSAAAGAVPRHGAATAEVTESAEVTPVEEAGRPSRPAPADPGTTDPAAPAARKSPRKKISFV